MTHPLSRAVWSALTTRQDAFAAGGTLARRFDPAVSPFAAARDNSPAALEALAELVGPGADRVYLLQGEDIALPDSLEAEMTAPGVLMTERTPSSRPAGGRSDRGPRAARHSGNGCSRGADQTRSVYVPHARPRDVLGSEARRAPCRHGGDAARPRRLHGD
ncbi:hypothetical protein QW131_02520 [Roseibium salinum]|nr:hypothetical protein [Roseibium salinum]